MADDELWERFLSGDKKALSYIYNAHYKPLLAYGLRLSSDYEFVRDCVQDIFVKLYVHRGRLSSTTHIRAYLTKALRNRLYDERKEQVEMSSIESSTLDFEADDFFVSLFGENDEDLAVKKKLRQAIRELSPHLREVIYLRFIRELDYKEIAEILDINYQSAKNSVSRALLKLRESYR